MLIILALLLLSHGTSKTCCSTLPDNSTDVLSLLAFKAANHCLWKGVNCSLTHPGRVTALELAGNKLAGSISSSLANLTFLRTLDLSANGFSGELPPLNHLHKLEILNLSSNLLQGSIPDLTNCSNLRTLDLSRNSLVGEIPPKVGLLYNLSVLFLFRNGLTGIIPPTISNITRLNMIGLSYNHLTGSIPDGFGKLRNASVLNLGGNNLSGEIPHDLFNMSSLRIISLEYNNLIGALPPNMGDVLPNIQKLYLDMNMLEGRIPASLGNASALDYIDLSSNSFIGQVPSSLGKLSKLSVLNLEINKLGAGDTQSLDFIHTLTNCTLLRVLSLTQNLLHGAIPNSVGNISINLQYLLLGRNNLSGIVPPSIGNLRALTKLALNNNNFSGAIEWIAQLNKLQGLVLQANNFSGPIPSSISNLTLLNFLVLGRNKFEGTIPPNFGNLQKLTLLDLSSNNLQGSIPLEIGNLNQLVNLSISSNQFTGEVTGTLGQCQTINTIQMEQNFLTGNIPMVFCSLESLNVLNLSYNHLYGEVPRNGAFANATVVSLNDNWGLCGGAIDLHMPACPDNSLRIKRSNYLITLLMPIFGFMSLVSLLVYLLLLVKKTPQKYISPASFGQDFLKVSYNDLARVTRNFSESNLVGRGSYGSVYRGKLKEDKTEVAVKVFNLEMQGAERSFMSECEALRNIQHRNLLPIIIACSLINNNGDAFKALVYEYMPNGNLDTWLHPNGEGKAPNKRLGLTQRISIAVNIADALDYLHHECARPTVHCDLKPSNILLDVYMTALLGDFGISRFYDDSSSTSTCSISTIGLKYTIGYIPPEYAGGVHVSTSGDVYSFGIVLLEMLTGKRPTHPMFKDGLDIVNFVESSLPEQILQVIDPHLVDECKEFSQQNMVPENAVSQCVASLLQVALSCTRPLPRERMNMKQIAIKMHAIEASCLVWKSKCVG